MNKLVVVGIIFLVGVIALNSYLTNKNNPQKYGEKMMEKVIESQTGSKVDINSNAKGDNITIKTDDGQVQYSAGGDIKVPMNFPQTFIVGGNPKLIMSTSSANGSSVTYITSDDKSVVVERILNDLTKMGWKKDMEVTTTGGMMVNMSKDKEAVVFSIGDNESEEQSGKTAVNIIWTINKDE